MSKLIKYGELTTQQHLAIEPLLMKRGANMTYAQIAEEIGVSTKTLERWRRLPEFQVELRRRSIETMAEALPSVVSTLTRKAMEGNNKSIELYLKTLGLLRQEFDITTR